MNLTFVIDYSTVYGQEIVLNIMKPDHTGSTPYRMATLDGHTWTISVALKQDADTLEYYYSVVRGHAVERTEWRVIMHRLEIGGEERTYRVVDRWTDMPDDSYLYSSAFTDCLKHTKTTRPKPSAYSRTLRLVVRAPQLLGQELLSVTGSDPALGNWNPNRSLLMTQHNLNEWVADIDVDRLKEGRKLEFKFFISSSFSRETPLWETSANRTLSLSGLAAGETLVCQMGEAHFDVEPTRSAGTLVPVFSLRTRRSFGVGDFGDLKLMIDWVSQTHQRVLQVLPINDTTTTHTWTDSYPYSCISIFALHPQYADLSQLPPLADKEKAEQFEKLRQELNALPQIDYERVNDAKLAYLREEFAQEGAKVTRRKDYKEFFEQNSSWLVPYAQYSFLRDKYHTADFSRWPDHRQWDEADRKALTTHSNKAYKEVAFYYFVQYILFSQMRQAHDYARQHNVILKGDIPIGVSRYGCDVWTEPRYFNLNGQAGAPPDAFSVNGQNWGFPTYNWDAMIEDGCQWWVRRFQNMQNFFDAYRIDHILGFFRIWEIPTDAVHGLLGQFQPSLGMSREEIEGYGLHWQEELFTTPFITDWVLDRIFKEHADEVKAKYVEKKDDQHYRMRPDYDTQRKVEAAFEGKTGDDDVWMRDGLYALISDVLFVRDHKNPNLFHPRISVQFDFIYESLYDSDKAVFNRLYNDYFYRRNNQFWYREAMKKLPRLVEATRMLVCAEDLGMVPDCVPWVMKELRILSLELQSMPKDPKVKFGHLDRNPYLSVCTISSHDMPTLRQWWDEDWPRTQDYYNTMLWREGPAPHPLPGWLARDIVSANLSSPSMLCIISIQDWLAIDETLRLPDANAERINIPADVHHYWRYRMHLNIEDLIANDNFKTNVAELVSDSGRK